ncbi:MAG: hypothetical protein CM1200mP2_10080 [Planctomycetaceae bacterium]|nr:MAG: hypothetical protein CM1200mP2_10080 [Planctomycetaceae bacterium]
MASPRGGRKPLPVPATGQHRLDVLDDLRRRYPIDPDRTYLAGFSGGGRVACTIGFALPEMFGGIVSFCAAGDLRPESWLRHRVTDRLSVALVTGETDFNRGEVERFRGPQLKEFGGPHEGVGRTRRWTPRCRQDRSRRSSNGSSRINHDEKKMATAWPASRLAPDTAPGRQEAARALLAEANKRLADPATLYSGLMQLKGIRVRWTGLPEAAGAETTLLKYDARDKRPWEKQDIAEQRMILIARARGIDAYGSGPLPKQYADGRADMLKFAITLWSRILQDGQDANAVQQARKRIPALRKRLSELDTGNDKKKAKDGR